MNSLKQVLRDAVGKLFFSELTVESTLDVSTHFRRINLVGAALENGALHAGDKLQILVDGGPRTFTPFDFDARRGALSLLAFLHGDTPAATWARDAAVGSKIQVFGPRSSLGLDALTGATVLVGDETSFALARTLLDTAPAARPAFLFEVTSLEESKRALDHLGVPTDGLVERRLNGAHFATLEQRVRSALTSRVPVNLVLTGRAQAIQELRASLRERPLPQVTQKVKAYWAPGKRGLD